MAAVEQNFRVETLLHNLKELQNEKTCLEQKLNEQRRKRRDAERHFEMVNMKWMQVSDMHQKMNETLKVAQLKVSQTQAQADSLEASNNKKREKIADLNKTIESEKQKQDKEVVKFEEELSKVSNMLMNARNFHQDENLESEYQKLESLQKEIINEKKCLSSEMENLSQVLETLTIEQKQDLDYPDITEDNRRTIWNLFKEENLKSKEFLEKKKQELEDVHTKLKESLE
ncbi:hypothetical protein LOTGIDRAFT_156257 [Lottia gigantea]|uniref:Uncharacterized protein n=1 Tax=Lottia gigantea TaxID=225164 RepID=V4B3P6_LOTGI|nr:hypothetical protein LOTGIDRAFT_156257 [Lottia gigantea]ESP05008.1 hypothetical protein LOTGIDRAFT_156257 [Lottia gigantea]